MSRSLKVEPLTREGFAPFGDVIDVRGAESFAINEGRTERFHALARVDVQGQDAQAIVSVFRGQPLEPLVVTVMERHPLGSQAFVPLNGCPFLAVVAPPGEFSESAVRAFLVRPDQGVNYHAGTWHAPLLPLAADADYLVVDRDGPGDNCDLVSLQEPVRPQLPADQL